MLGDDRIEARRQNRQDRLGDNRTDAGATERQRAGPREEDRVNDLALDRRSIPAAFERISARCNSVRRSAGIRVWASDPNPVETS